MAMGGLLLVLAHPDDETLFGGTVARYTSAGVDAGLICGTRGERGKTSGLCSVEELGRVRESELRESARILGIHRLEILPYVDQQLHAAPHDEIRRHIVALVRELRPQVVITFDPHGA